MADGDFGSAYKDDGSTHQPNLGRDRGEVGLGTPGSRLKSRYHAYGRGLRFKAFVRDEAARGNPDAAAWFKNKGPSQKNKDKAAKEKKRGATIRATALATKQAKSSSKK